MNIQFDINQLLNFNDAYKLLEDYEARALIYQRLLLSDENSQKLTLLSLLHDLFKKSNLSNAFDEELAIKLKKNGNYVVADFICPTPEARSLFPADFIIWVDTIKEGRFDDTNKMFVKPDKYDFHVTTQDAKNWAPKILKEIK